MQEKQKRVRMHTNREAAIRAVRHVKCFRYKSFDLFRDDEEVVLAAVRLKLRNFKYASDRLKGSKEFVRKLLDQGIYCLPLASEAVRSDKDIVIASRRLPYGSVDSISESLRDDVDVIEAAIQNFFKAYFFASPRLQSDKRILLSAIRRAPDHELCIDSFKGLMPETFYGDFEIMSEFLRCSPDKTVEVASEGLRNNKAFALMAVRLCGNALANFSLSLQEDPDVVFAALHANRNAAGASNIPAKLKDERSFVLSVLAARHHGLECASDRLRDDDEVVSAAIWLNPLNAMYFASKRLKSEKRFVLNACRANRSAIRHADAQLCGLVGEKDPVDELIRLIESEELYLALKKKLDVPNGAVARTRPVQKV